MNGNSEENTLETLTSANWKQRLQEHYLFIEGPYGHQPLEWLDATPEELAHAIGFPEAAQEQVLSAFIKLFSRNGVRRVLGKEVGKHQGRFAYDNFHYLILSCFVIATPIGAGENKDFRDRIGELLGDGQGREQGVVGINSLWEALANWVTKEPSLRLISLPEPGNYTQIGIALRLAYPSWEDLSALKKILKKAQPKDLQSRYTLLQLIRRHQAELPASSQHRMGSHLRELFDRFAHGQPLESQPFWRIVERALGDLKKSGDSTTATLLWRLSLDFNGLDESGADVLIAKGSRREDLSHPFWEESFEQLLHLSNDSSIPVQIRQLLAIGTILLFENHNGLWSQDDRPMNDVQAIILTNKKVYIDNFKQPLALVRGWFASEPMDAEQAKSMTQNEGLAINPREATREFSIEGGVKVRKGCWLGFPGYLPHIHLPEDAQVASQPELDTCIKNHVVSINAEKTLDGQWSIQLKSDHFYKSFALQFTNRADRNVRWPHRPENGFADAQEVEFDEGDLVTAGQRPTQSGLQSLRLLDALEAIYARAGGVRSEREILALLKPVLPAKLNPWDLLRSLEESGWLEQDVSTRWRGRRWRALPPRLVKTHQNTAIIEGATGQVELELLKAEAQRLSIDYFFNAEHPWSVPIVGVVGEHLEQLAQALGWPVIHARHPIVQPAPQCWIPDSRTPTGLQLTSVWNAKTGQFDKKEQLSNSGQMQLARYVREDSQDLFCLISKNQPVFCTSERTAALLDYAGRMGNPLFIKQGGTLIRQAQWGYLPLCVAQWLRRTSAQQTGPRQLDAGFTYGYTAIDAQISVLKRTFGQAIGDAGRVGKQDFIQLVAQNRHRGQRNHWLANNREQA